MNRKGIAYTLVSLVLLVAIGALFFTQSMVDHREQQSAAHDRIRTVNSFIHDLETDTQRAAYVAGYRSLIAMEQHVTSTGDYLADPSSAFITVFLTGSYGGFNFAIMDNSTFNDYLLRVREEAGGQGITFNVTSINISLWQTSPWHVRVNYTLEMNISDKRGTASWNIERSFMGEVPITDLRDPLYTKSTLGRVPRVIVRTNVSQFVNDAADANDTTGLMSHLNNSMYIARGRGPSILMRFQGNTSDSVFGIESLVDTEELSAQGLDIFSSRSIVDYEYFGEEDATVCNIQNLPSKIKFRAGSLAVYEIAGKLDYGSC